jgi:hypothetical protein
VGCPSHDPEFAPPFTWRKRSFPFFALMHRSPDIWHMQTLELNSFASS